MATRLILVDDHPLVREGVRQRLESIPHLCVVGEASSADEVVALVREQNPALALIDIGLPGMNGIALTHLLRTQFPSLAVLLLTMYDSDDYVAQAVRAGARGYVLKDSPMKQIVAAIEAVAAGGTYYSSSVMGAVSCAATHSPLSPREREILNQLIRGCSNKEVARSLNLSVRTIETHRKNIKRKLGAGRAVDLGKYAVQMGLAKE